MKCNCCNEEKELRFGICFDCADAESIISEGLDMWEKGINGAEIPAKSPLQKLKLLIKKGWRFPS